MLLFWHKLKSCLVLRRHKRAKVLPLRLQSSRLPLCLEGLETRLLPSLTPVQLPPINPDTFSSTPKGVTEFDGRAFFSAIDGIHGRQLWESNGSAAGTFMVKDINGKSGSYPYSLTNVNGTLFFSAFDDTHGRQLWKTNGSAAGTSMVTDINLGFGLHPFPVPNFLPD